MNRITPRPLKPTFAFMAFSTAGYPALFIGASSFARVLREGYQERFGRSLEAAGYRVRRVRIAPASPSKA